MGQEASEENTLVKKTDNARETVKGKVATFTEKTAETSDSFLAILENIIWLANAIWLARNKLLSKLSRNFVKFDNKANLTAPHFAPIIIAEALLYALVTIAKVGIVLFSSENEEWSWTLALEILRSLAYATLMMAITAFLIFHFVFLLNFTYLVLSGIDIVVDLLALYDNFCQLYEQYNKCNNFGFKKPEKFIIFLYKLFFKNATNNLNEEIEKIEKTKEIERTEEIKQQLKGMQKTKKAIENIRYYSKRLVMSTIYLVLTALGTFGAFANVLYFPTQLVITVLSLYEASDYIRERLQELKKWISSSCMEITELNIAEDGSEKISTRAISSDYDRAQQFFEENSPTSSCVITSGSDDKLSAGQEQTSSSNSTVIENKVENPRKFENGIDSNNNRITVSAY